MQNAFYCTWLPQTPKNQVNEGTFCPFIHRVFCPFFALRGCGQMSFFWISYAHKCSPKRTWRLTTFDSNTPRSFWKPWRGAKKSPKLHNRRRPKKNPTHSPGLARVMLRVILLTAGTISVPVVRDGAEASCPLRHHPLQLPLLLRQLLSN